jgi:hypothetical protein
MACTSPYSHGLNAMLGLLLQAKIALAHLLGIDQLRRQRDTYRYKRDIALGEGNGFLRQLQVWPDTCFGPSEIALRGLANRINAQIAQPSSVFLLPLIRRAKPSATPP